MKKHVGLIALSLTATVYFGSIPTAEAHGCPDQIEQKCNSPTDIDPLEQTCYQLHQWPTCGCVAQAVQNTPAELICGYDSNAAHQAENNPPPPAQSLPNSPYQANANGTVTPQPAPIQPPPSRPLPPKPYEPGQNLYLQNGYHFNANDQRKHLLKVINHNKVQAHLMKVDYVANPVVPSQPRQASAKDYPYWYAALVQAGYAPRRVDLEHRRLSPLEFQIWAENRLNYRVISQNDQRMHDLVMDNAPLNKNGL